MLQLAAATFGTQSTLNLAETTASPKPAWPSAVFAAAVQVQFAQPNATQVQNGFCIDENGLVLTCHHGYAPGAEIRITTAEGQTWRARVARAEPATDRLWLSPRFAKKTPCLQPAALPAFNSPAYCLGFDRAGVPSVQDGRWVMAKAHLSCSELGAEALVRQRFALEGAMLHTLAISPGWSGSAMLNVVGQRVAIKHVLFETAIAALTLASFHQASAARHQLVPTAEAHIRWLSQGLARHLIWQGVDPDLSHRLAQDAGRLSHAKQAWAWMLTEVKRHQKAAKQLATG